MHEWHLTPAREEHGATNEGGPMIASVQIADVPVHTALATLGSAPKLARTTGVRWSKVMLAAPLREQLLPKPSLKRVALLSFWDDDVALDGYAFPDAFSDGWGARLEPLRVHGAWPGLDPNLPTARKVEYTGPAIVFTLGRLRVTQGVRFLRASARAEEAVLRAPGCSWATGLGRPPFVATCSLWDSYDAIAAYAFNEHNGGHPAAIAEGRRKPFHKQEAFIRFRPYGMRGSLTGTNPIPEHIDG
jgi:hypothetical protein